MMKMENIYDLSAFKSFIDSSEIVVVYYSNDACNVCKTLKPKILDKLASDFPETRSVYIDTEKSPVIAGQHRVFSIPTIDIYVMGKEHARFGRSLVMHEFDAALRKPYDMLINPGN